MGGSHGTAASSGAWASLPRGSRVAGCALLAKDQRQQRPPRHADAVGKSQELPDVIQRLASAGLDPPDRGLRAAQKVRELKLRQAGGDPADDHHGSQIRPGHRGVQQRRIPDPSRHLPICAAAGSAGIRRGPGGPHARPAERIRVVPAQPRRPAPSADPLPRLSASAHDGHQLLHPAEHAWRRMVFSSFGSVVVTEYSVPSPLIRYASSRRFPHRFTMTTRKSWHGDLVSAIMSGFQAGSAPPAGRANPECAIPAPSLVPGVRYLRSDHGASGSTAEPLQNTGDAGCWGGDESVKSVNLLTGLLRLRQARSR